GRVGVGGFGIQDAELFLFEAPGVEALRAKVERVLSYAPRLSRAELVDCAAQLQRMLGTEAGQVRAAVVASTPSELAEQLSAVLGARGETKVPRSFSRQRRFEAGIGFLFPGQGSPASLDGGLWARRFGFVRALYKEAHLPSGISGVNTAVAQPAIVTAE